MDRDHSRIGPGWRISEIAASGVLLAVVLCSAAAPSAAQSLRGSSRSLTIQNDQAHAHDFSYLETPARVRRFVELGYLVPVNGNRDYQLHDVSFPYARTEVRTFIERLASQYRRACGEILVVTSLTRPLNRQPRNASARSVHPTGMALDLRRSQSRTCRSWLEDVLLMLEGRGVLEATRESRPPHYHIALFPNPYASYVETLLARADGAESTEASDLATEASDPATATVVAQNPGTSAEVPAESREYRVRSGDALWDIARAYRTTVGALQRSNSLNGNRIHPGQILNIPTGSGAGDQARYRVRTGDSLWDIARVHRVTVSALRQSNNLRGSRIYPGQVLTIPMDSR